jgi:hypothetical protein
MTANPFRSPEPKAKAAPQGLTKAQGEVVAKTMAALIHQHVGPLKERAVQLEQTFALAQTEAAKAVEDVTDELISTRKTPTADDLVQKDARAKQ